MILLIDAFNLVYKMDGLDEFMFRGDLGAAMQGLKAELIRFDEHSRVKNEYHVFFDGKRKNGDATKRLKEGILNLYFSHDVSADHLIMEFIKRNPAPGNLTVVSTDKQIRHFAKPFKCKLYLSEEFADILRNANTTESSDVEPAKPKKQSAAEIEYWLNMFRKKG